MIVIRTLDDVRRALDQSVVSTGEELVLRIPPQTSRCRLIQYAWAADSWLTERGIENVTLVWASAEVERDDVDLLLELRAFGLRAVTS